MGKIKNNVVTKGFSGKFGDDLVFRQVDDATIFAKRTVVTTEPTEKQLETRNRFAEAALYAKAALDNAQASQEYKLMAELQGLKSAYVAAVTDFLTMPEVGSVFARSYKGAVGDIINITAKVPFKVVELDVKILRPDGSVLESGKATANELKWRYAATVVNPQVVGSKLVLTARDRQKKESSFELVL